MGGWSAPPPPLRPLTEPPSVGRPPCPPPPRAPPSVRSPVGRVGPVPDVAGPHPAFPPPTVGRGADQLLRRSVTDHGSTCLAAFRSWSGCMCSASVTAG